MEARTKIHGLILVWSGECDPYLNNLAVDRTESLDKIGMFGIAATILIS